MNVLSCFNGCGTIWYVLHELGLKVEKRYVSEIDKYANIVNDKNYPDSIHLGDIRNVLASDLPKIDLLVAGSPCQGFSFAGKQLNFNDERSRLFFKFVRLRNELLKKNPKMIWLLENVPMKKEYENVITNFIGCQPLKINSALVSAQNRKRLYWCNINLKPVDLFGTLKPQIPQPKDRGLLLKDILEKHVEKKYFLSNKTINNLLDSKILTNVNPSGNGMNGNVFNTDFKSPALTTNKGEGIKIGCAIVGRKKVNGVRKDLSNEKNIQTLELRGIKSACITTVQKDSLVLCLNTYNQKGKQRSQQDRIYSIDFKSKCLDTDSRNNIIENTSIRRLTPIECERLQTLPDDFTAGVSNTQRYKMLGNGWTAEVIKHILSYMKT